MDKLSHLKVCHSTLWNPSPGNSCCRGKLSMIGTSKCDQNHFSHICKFGHTANIRLSWKGLPGTNALAYYKNSQITSVKSFITLGPGRRTRRWPCPRPEMLLSTIASTSLRRNKPDRSGRWSRNLSSENEINSRNLFFGFSRFGFR